MGSCTSKETEPKSTYSEPYVVAPKSGTHKQTFIVLHGRGSNGEDFGAQLLMYPVCGFESLRSAFPDAKFIFPTASKRRVRVLNNSTINQWFDICSLLEPDEREDAQFEGLRESSAYVHSLLEAAIREVPARNVVLWGLSQGCAIGLISLLLWDGEPFAATVGMCGWLPLKTQMEISIAGHSRVEVDDPFSREEAEPEPDNLEIAVAYLREIIDIPAKTSVCQQIPVFLGHGEWDPKVSVDLGRQATSFLKSLVLNVDWREYHGLGHWYSKEMLSDIVSFLFDKCAVTHE